MVSAYKVIYKLLKSTVQNEMKIINLHLKIKSLKESRDNKRLLDKIE